MRKHLLTAALAILVATPAAATQSRINSMGGGVKQFTVLDDRNIFVLPAELVKWGTWTGLEIGGPGFTSFGIHYNFNPTTVLAIYGTNEDKSSTTFGSSISGTLPGVSQAGDADVGDAGRHHKLTTIFGVDLGTTRLGFGLGIWADRTVTFNDSGTETSNNGPLVMDINLGAGFALGSADLDLGLGFTYRAPTDVDQDADGDGVQSSINSEIDIGLLGRLTVPFSGPHEIIAFLGVGLAIGNGQLDQDDPTQHSGLSYLITLGTDVRLNLADGIIVQPGIGVAFGGATVTQTPASSDDPIQDFKESLMAIPFYNVAVDVKVFDWLDIRFGGSQSVVFNRNESLTDGSSNGGASSSDVVHSIATGVGINLPAGVSIDIEVSTGWWKNGPQILTGGSNAGEFGLNAALHKDW